MYANANKELRQSCMDTYNTSYSPFIVDNLGILENNKRQVKEKEVNKTLLKGALFLFSH